jgi:hypothetical protein
MRPSSLPALACASIWSSQTRASNSTNQARNLALLMLGGSNRAQFGGFGYPITHATVEVDGKVVVKDGKLTL